MFGFSPRPAPGGSRVDIDPGVSVAGLVVGVVVGLTGMGGGALLTPIMVLVFGVQPLAAVSSDLVAGLVMKPIGGGVHLRRGTVHMGIVRWLVVGSVPAAFTGVLLLRALGDGEGTQHALKIMLGVALLTAATAMVVKVVLTARRPAQVLDLEPPARPLVTVAIGVVGGLLVGLTSVGSGSLIIVMLLAAYPTLRSSALVGTDLVQAVPLIAAAAFGHLLFGDFRLGLTTSLLIGAVPGVYFGARWSSRAPDAFIRPVLVVVLAASALKLLGVPTAVVGGLLGLALAVGAVAVVRSRRGTRVMRSTTVEAPVRADG
jgi:uncharacterized protein